MMGTEPFSGVISCEGKQGKGIATGREPGVNKGIFLFFLKIGGSCACKLMGMTNREKLTVLKKRKSTG